MNETQRKIVIAIDGPAGSGKSTLASKIARHFNYVNIETGAMYRALALKAIESDMDFEDEASIMRLAEKSSIRLEPRLDGNRVFLDGYDVSERIRDKDVTEGASKVSVHPRVREWMVDQQRKLGSEGGVVMEGRDIGTKVFPNAEVKIFLDAAPEVRGDRRYRQKFQGQPEDPKQTEAVIAELRERDHRDRTRANSPLEAAADAVIIDSTGLSLDDVMKRAEEIIHKALAK